MTIGCDIWLISLKLNRFFYRLSRMFHLSDFVWTPRSSVFVVFKNFLLIDATDRSKISSDQKRFFIALSRYPLSFFANTPFKQGAKIYFLNIYYCCTSPPVTDFKQYFELVVILINLAFCVYCVYVTKLHQNGGTISGIFSLWTAWCNGLSRVILRKLLCSKHFQSSRQHMFPFKTFLQNEKLSLFKVELENCEATKGCKVLKEAVHCAIQSAHQDNIYISYLFYLCVYCVCSKRICMRRMYSNKPWIIK